MKTLLLTWISVGVLNWSFALHDDFMKLLNGNFAFHFQFRFAVWMETLLFNSILWRVCMETLPFTLNLCLHFKWKLCFSLRFYNAFGLKLCISLWISGCVLNWSFALHDELMMLLYGNFACHFEFRFAFWMEALLFTTIFIMLL